MKQAFDGRPLNAASEMVAHSAFVSEPRPQGSGYRDGRDIDTSLAELTGEAAQQITGASEPAEVAREQLPVPRAGDPTYYDRPLLKQSVWKPFIPLYYFTGGAAGASLVLGAAAQFDGSRELDRFIRRCHWIGIIGSTISGGLLIADLGRPERFLYMLRVFRPTSPMNMGAWILAAAPSAAITAGLFARHSHGILQRIGEAAGYSSGVFGAALATYTGVLAGNTVIPVWKESRRILPVLFGASAAASAGAIFDLMFEEERACRITRYFGIGGRLAELAAAHSMERGAARVPTVARPLKRGLSGVMWKTASVLTAASLVTLMLPRQNRKKRMVAGLLGAGGSLLMRFAVEAAGNASARDPRATFHQQRAGQGTREVE